MVKRDKHSKSTSHGRKRPKQTCKGRTRPKQNCKGRARHRRSQGGHQVGGEKAADEGQSLIVPSKQAEPKEAEGWWRPQEAEADG